MIKIEKYISQLTDLLKKQFNSRLVYVGLQGSYIRGEESDSSDIDIMVIIDDLSVSDLDCYRSIISSLEAPEKSCGFICSKTDMVNWNPLEIFHILNSTRDYYGVLKELVPGYSEYDIKNFVKVSLNNMYHEICHRYIHADKSKNIAKLPGTYKGVFFILQNLHYLKSGEYIQTKADLLPLLSDKDNLVLKRSIELGKGIPYDFSDSFELLFTWCQDTLNSL